MLVFGGTNVGLDKAGIIGRKFITIVKVLAKKSANSRHDIVSLHIFQICTMAPAGKNIPKSHRKTSLVA